MNSSFVLYLDAEEVLRGVFDGCQKVDVKADVDVCRRMMRKDAELVESSGDASARDRSIIAASSLSTDVRLVLLKQLKHEVSVFIRDAEESAEKISLNSRTRNDDFRNPIFDADIFFDLSVEGPDAKPECRTPKLVDQRTVVLVLPGEDGVQIFVRASLDDVCGDVTPFCSTGSSHDGELGKGLEGADREGLLVRRSPDLVAKIGLFHCECPFDGKDVAVAVQSSRRVVAVN